ncbi:MAG: hypothetical protein J2P37_02670 [Ktedonobacteraceae bacterium]|nr:hypothetical protein [Ktedonobacteraceae bacterium]
MEQRYPAVGSDIRQELGRVKITLMDTEYGKKILESLQEKLKGQALSLDEFLNEVEVKEQGFTRREIVKALLDRDAFMKYLHDQKQILDAGTPSEHGPYSHRLQWYILYQAHTGGRLKMRPVDLYRALGDPSCKDPIRATRTIWDDVFDFDAESRSFIDISAGTDDFEAQKTAGFSSPEFLLSFVTSPDFPDGLLKRTLRLVRLRHEALSATSVFDLKSAFIDGIVLKMYMKDDKIDIDKLKQELGAKTDTDLETQYLPLNKAYAETLKKILS